jgi:hypothetical protein
MLALFFRVLHDHIPTLLIHLQDCCSDYLFSASHTSLIIFAFDDKNCMKSIYFTINYNYNSLVLLAGEEVLGCQSNRASLVITMSCMCAWLPVDRHVASVLSASQQQNHVYVDKIKITQQIYMLVPENGAAKRAGSIYQGSITCKKKT